MQEFKASKKGDKTSYSNMERDNMSILTIFRIQKLEDTSSHQFQAALHRAHGSGAKGHSSALTTAAFQKYWCTYVQECCHQSAFVLFTQMTQQCPAAFKIP